MTKKRNTTSMDHLFDENTPIYAQIIQRISARILRGEYQPGDKLPSVIDAAMHFKVNHNTIVRVYNEMARDGIVNTRRGEGTFVTENEGVLARLHQSIRQSLLQDFYTEMRRLGYSGEEILEAVNHFIQNRPDTPAITEENKE